MQPMDMRGLSPAPVTAFTRDGEVDHKANAKLAKWLVSMEGVKSLVILGHAGEGTFLTEEERLALIHTYVEAVDGAVPIIAGIIGEGTKVAAEEARNARSLVPPAHSSIPTTAGCVSAFRRERLRIATRQSGRSLASSASCSNIPTPPRHHTISIHSLRLPHRKASSPPRTACAI